MLAVSVITPSRSSKTASYRSRVVGYLLSDCSIDRSPVTPRCERTSPTERATALTAGGTQQRPVPDPHGGIFAVVTEHTQRAGIEQEVLSGTRGEPDPAGDEHAQHVTMGEQRDVARDSARSGNDPVRPVTDLLRRLAARGSVPEDEPARRSLVDLLRC